MEDKRRAGTSPTSVARNSKRNGLLIVEYELNERDAPLK